MTKYYLPEDKKCAHCGGNLSPHYLGELGGIKIWCDDCGSNSPESPPSVEIMTKQIDTLTLCENCYCMTKSIDGKCGKCGLTDINVPKMTKQTSTTQGWQELCVDVLDGKEV